MNSPARRHRERANALNLARQQGLAVAANAAPEIDENDPVAGEYRHLLAKLHEDLRTLHEIQSVQEKIARKREMIDSYLPWVNGALDAGAEGRAVQDEIVVTVMIWALDIQNWPLALDLGEHVLKHGLALPERYKRTAATLIVEEVAEAAKADPASVRFDVLQTALVLSEGRDMPDQVRAKLHRAIGLALAAEADAFDPAAETAVAGGKAALLETALVNLRTALRFDKNVGVKKQIEQLEREAKKLAEQAGAPQN